MIIFDLDGTVLDSSHRHATLADGSLDLAHWIENNTPEKIAQDSLLPLVGVWYEAKNNGSIIGVCTARVLQDADYAFLADNGLEFEFCLSRKLGDNSGDADLKENLLREYARSKNVQFDKFCQSIDLFLDDNLNVLKRLETLSIKTLDAKLCNYVLQAY
jgi:hypothetical protein